MVVLVVLFALVVVVLLFMVVSFFSFYVHDVYFYQHFLRQIEEMGLWSKIVETEREKELIEMKKKYERKWSIRLWKFFHQQPA